MVAYLTKVRGGFELRFTVRPCNGPEFQAAEVVKCADKKEARAICKARNATPYNF
ncbi:hypothetical protein [Caudoviricetes sp.]|nr:hypothetical protein [Caudoviricetes sp.]